MRPLAVSAEQEEKVEKDHQQHGGTHTLDKLVDWQVE